jgi:hypothetical protein
MFDIYNATEEKWHQLHSNMELYTIFQLLLSVTPAHWKYENFQHSQGAVKQFLHQK